MKSWSTEFCVEFFSLFSITGLGRETENARDRLVRYLCRYS